MSVLVASGVPHADHLNEAASRYGVNQALLQGMLDIDGLDVFDLPAPAVEYADAISRSSGGIASQETSGHQQPRWNIMAAAWFLVEVNEMYGNQTEAVSQFYGGGPRGRIKAARIIAGPFERRRRQWS